MIVATAYRVIFSALLFLLIADLPTWRKGRRQDRWFRRSDRRFHGLGLRESERYHRMLTESLTDFVIHLDRDGCIQYINRVAEGYSIDMVRGRHFFDFLAPESREITLQAFNTVIETGQPASLENVGRRSSTIQGWYFTRLVPISHNSTVTGALLIATDITERKQREEQVSWQNRKLVALNAIIAATNELFDPMSLTDLLQTMVDRGAEALLANRVSLITFDIERKQIIDFVSGGPGAQHIEVVTFDELWEGLSGWVLREEKPALSLKMEPDPRESTAVQQRRAETNCGSIIVVPLRYQSKVLGTMTAINQPDEPDFSDQAVDLMSTIANQVAVALEKTRLLRQLREQQARLVGIIDAAMDAIITVDSNQHVVLFNPAAEHIFGHPAVEAIGKPFDCFIPERFRLAHQESFHRFDQAGNTMHTSDMSSAAVGLRASGEEFPLEGSVSQLEVAGQKLYTVILRDISQRKRDEVAIQQLLAQVTSGRQQLQMLSRRLLDVQEDERRHLARELHDEIGQMLTGLNLSLEAGSQISDPLLKNRLETAQKMVRELTARVRQLSLDLRPAMLDDLGLLPTLLWHFKRYTEQTRVEVHFQHTGLDRRFASSLEISTYRVVQEALTNVARHAHVQTAMVRVWANSDVLGMEVEDEGVGFEQVEVLTRHNSSGLAGIRERIILLGGDVRIESMPGSGTIVTAELPLTGSLERRRSER